MSKQNYTSNNYQIISLIMLFLIGFICGFGATGGFEQPVKETGTDKVFIIQGEWDGCDLAVDLDNVVGYKCNGFFSPIDWHGFKLRVDGNWKEIVGEL